MRRVSRRDLLSLSLIWTSLSPVVSRSARSRSAAVGRGGGAVAKDRYVHRAMAAIMERVAARIPKGQTLGHVNVEYLKRQARYHRWLAERGTDADLLRQKARYKRCLALSHSDAQLAT
jgi:hypothetical protein